MGMHSIVLGFDFGLRKIGVAIGQPITKTATPLPLLKAENGVPHWQHIQDIIDEWGVKALIVGLPLNMDQTEQPITQKAKQFGESLKKQFGLPVFFVDERLTTIAAKADIHEVITSKKRFAPADGHSARLIVESWLAQEK